MAFNWKLEEYTGIFWISSFSPLLPQFLCYWICKHLIINHTFLGRTWLTFSSLSLLSTSFDAGLCSGLFNRRLRSGSLHVNQLIHQRQRTPHNWRATQTRHCRRRIGQRKDLGALDKQPPPKKRRINAEETLLKHVFYLIFRLPIVKDFPRCLPLGKIVSLAFINPFSTSVELDD